MPPEALFLLFFIRGSFPSDVEAISQSNPNHHDDNVHALVLATVELVAPHAVRLLVPERARSAVHASAADVWLSVSGGRRCGGGCLAFGLGLIVTAGAGRGALGLVELGGGDEVLYDGAVDGEFEGRC